METNSSTAAAIAALTSKGREAMTDIGGMAFGKRVVSFFDDGLRAGSGSWGEALTGDLGHRSSGVINRLAKLGMFTVTKDVDGSWFELTELGADVARQLAAPAEPEPTVEVVAGTVELSNGRPARAHRSTVTGSAPIVRYADSAGRARTATGEVAATFAPLTDEQLDQAHGVALIEAAGHGVRILVPVTVDQHDTAFAGRLWPTVEGGQLHGSIDSVRVAVGGQWYQLTRVQMPSGERRRFARQYNGYGDGPADVREASMLFGCAWSEVPVVEGPVEQGPADISAEHEQALINAAADELHRIADDADREAAEALADQEWGTSPAGILAEPDVDTSGCSNPWHRSAGLYSRRACPECPPVERPVEVVELPAAAHSFKVGQLVEVDTRHLATEPERWERATVYAVGGLLGGRNVEVEYAAGGVSPVPVARIRPATGNPNVCSHGYRFENGLCPDKSCGASTFEPTVTGPINDRMAIWLRYFREPTSATLAPLQALRGQQTGTLQALTRRRLTEPSDAFPFTILTALGRQVLADYDRTDPQT